MLACLGENICGKDIDRTCGYSTPKIVKIRNRELGCLSNCLKILIIWYIFIFTIWFKGKHFEVFAAHGLSRLTFHHPTKNMCNPKLKNCHSNFTRFDKLPYCKESGEDGLNPQLQKPCSARDGLGLPVQYDSGILLPTRIRQYDQGKQQCTPDADNGYSCPGIWDYLDGSGQEQEDTKPKPLYDTFVADLEQFTMQIDHSYAVPELGWGNDDYQMQGYWMDCEHTGKNHLTVENCKRRPIVCMRKRCQPFMVTGEKNKKEKLQNFLASADDNEDSKFADFADEDDDLPEIGGEVQHEAEAEADGHRHNLQRNNLDGGHMLNSNHGHHHPHHVIDEIRYPEMALMQSDPSHIANADSVSSEYPFVSGQHGDILSIGHLLQMAGVELDDRHFGKTFRMRGVVLVVRITYSNAERWQLWEPKHPPEYTIEVTRRPSYEFQYDQAIPGESPTRRSYMSYHGIFIHVEQQGELRAFSWIHLLVILSGALSLLKAAAMATDFAACNLIANKDEVKSLKYEESRDFYPEN